ncbi:hypothetical protein LT875_002429 [Salmonella enterica]|nr:hypothetical protein [Salmonella enterica]
MPAILTESGREAVAAAINNQPIFLAWGTGDVSWDASAPTEAVGTTALLAEVGRRKLTQSMFCSPKTDGEIIVSQGRFTASPNNAPTKYLYLRFAYDFTDATGQSIRELGVFVGTTLKSGLASGTDYVLPAQVDDPGRLLVLEYIDKLTRTSQIRQQFEFVIQF